MTKFLLIALLIAVIAVLALVRGALPPTYRQRPSCRRPPGRHRTRCFGHERHGSTAVGHHRPVRPCPRRCSRNPSRWSSPSRHPSPRSSRRPRRPWSPSRSSSRSLRRSRSPSSSPEPEPVEPEPVVEPEPEPVEPEPVDRAGDPSTGRSRAGHEPEPEPFEPEPVIEPDTAGVSHHRRSPGRCGGRADDRPATGRHRRGRDAAVDLDPHAGWEARRRPDDPRRSGVRAYHTPDSPGYKLGPDGQVFESEEEAREAGFTRWDEPG